jgi:hypothetical protein
MSCHSPSLGFALATAINPWKSLNLIASYAANYNHIYNLQPPIVTANMDSIAHRCKRSVKRHRFGSTNPSCGTQRYLVGLNWVGGFNDIVPVCHMLKLERSVDACRTFRTRTRGWCQRSRDRISRNEIAIVNSLCWDWPQYLLLWSDIGFAMYRTGLPWPNVTIGSYQTFKHLLPPNIKRNRWEQITTFQLLRIIRVAARLSGSPNALEWQ